MYLISILQAHVVCLERKLHNCLDLLFKFLMYSFVVKTYYLSFYLCSMVQPYSSFLQYKRSKLKVSDTI